MPDGTNCYCSILKIAETIFYAKLGSGPRTFHTLVHCSNHLATEPGGNLVSKWFTYSFGIPKNISPSPQVQAYFILINQC